MANTHELSKLLAMRKPPRASAEEAVKDPTDAGHLVGKAVLSPARHNNFYFKSDSFESPEVDFGFIRQAIKVEPLFRRRNERYQNLMWKNGYTLRTEDEEAKQYIQSRMEVFAVLMGQTFDSFLREATNELIQYNNCLLYERRVPARQLQEMGINLPAKGIGPLAKKGPVVCHEVIPLETIRYKRDAFGNITQWKQVSPEGKERIFSPKEVILIKVGGVAGEILAHPTLHDVIPDAKILRQLETDASLAGHRLAFPIFMYKVGDPRYEGTMPKKASDLDGIWNTLEGMLMDGTLIIPGSDTFEVVLSDVKLDGLQAVLQYFKDRVVSNMGLSPLHLGDPAAANRSVADRLDVQLYDDVKAYQRVTEENITWFIFLKWLMEGGYSMLIGSAAVSPSRVYMTFKEIDTDSMIQRENHAVALWVQDAITHDEVRDRLGYTPLAEEEIDKLYSSMIGAITNKQAMDLAKVGAAASADGPSKSTAQATKGGSNQKTNAKTRAKKTSSLESEEIEAVDFTHLLGQIREAQQTAIDTHGLSVVEQSWAKLQIDVTEYIQRMSGKNFSAEDMSYVKDLFKSELWTSLRSCIVMSLNEGIDRGYEEARGINPDVAPMAVTRFNRNVSLILNSLNTFVDKLVEDLFVRVETEVVDSEDVAAAVDDAFMALHYRLEQVVTSHNALASNWGVCMVADHAGYEQVWQESESDCLVCKSGWVSTKDIRHTDIPPFSTHPNCGCRVHIKDQ
jgi:hypothetical protein